MPTRPLVNNSPFKSDNRNEEAYPAFSGIVMFGNDAAHHEFAVPMARFQFYNSVGGSRGAKAPILYMRMGGQFTTGLINGYEAATNIYGNPSGSEAAEDDLFKLPSGVTGGLTALYKQIANVGTNAMGFLASAGTNGKAQYEFLTRRVLNTFQQLIYQGPTFRRYSLPFTMKPTSLDEAKAMITIIKTFRIASSPRGGAPETITTEDRAASRVEGDRDFIAQGVDGSAIATVAELLKTTPIAFGYPDMCTFEIVMAKASSAAITSTETVLPTQIFGSEFCVIENVQVDYGSQNKMLFFAESVESGGKYYPAEVTLTISLKETTLPLGMQITQENNLDATNTRTIF